MKGNGRLFESGVHQENGDKDMTRQRYAILIAVLAWVLVLLSASCALAPPREVPPQTGRVLDVETQQPIEGAIVVLRWQGVGTKAFVDTQTVCYHVESAVTDTEGRYKTDGWREAPIYRDLSMKQVLHTVYKPGYRHVRTDIATGDQYLEKDARSVKERLEYLISTSVSCSAVEDKKLSNLYRSLYSEAESVATTKEEVAIALILLIEVEKQEVGSTEAWRRFEQRKLELR